MKIPYALHVFLLLFFANSIHAQYHLMCEGSVETLTAGSYPGLTNITYSINPGGNSGTVPHFPVSPSVTTTYSLYTTGNNGTSNVTYSSVVTVTVINKITCTISSPQNFVMGCGSNSAAIVQLSNFSNPNAGLFTFTLLTAGSGPVAVGMLQYYADYTITAPGSYSVLIRTSLKGCNTYVPFSVTQNTLAPVLDTVTGNLLLNCFNPITTLQAKSLNNNVTFTWTAPGPTTVVSDQLAVSVNTSAPTSTLVANFKLELKDQSTQCLSTHTVQVKQNLYPPIALIGSIGSLTCKQPTLELTNQSKTGIPVNSGYPTNSLVIGSLWEGPTPMSPANNASTYTAAVAGVYTLTVTDLNNGCTAKKTNVVGENKVFPLIQATAPGNICGNITTATLAPVIISSTTGLSYTWTIPTNAVTSDVNALTLTSNMLGVYVLNVTNTSNGCVSSETMQVVQCVGVFDYENAEINLFPNPANDILYFSSEEDGQCEIIVIDAAGKLVMKEVISANEQIDIQQLEKGVYFVNVLIDGNLKSRMCLVKM